MFFSLHNKTIRNMKGFMIQVKTKFKYFLFIIYIYIN